MTSDAILLHRYCAERDPGAFSALVERYADMVYRTCLRITRSPSDAEDASQECFLELARGAIAVRGHLGAWLHTVARRCALRQQQRGERHVALHEASEPASAPSAQDELGRVDEALAKLPERERLVVLLRFVERLTQAEVAQRLGCDQATVSRSEQRGLEHLRRLLSVATVLAAAQGLQAASIAQAAPPAVAATAKLGLLAPLIPAGGVTAAFGVAAKIAIVVLALGASAAAVMVLPGGGASREPAAVAVEEPAVPVRPDLDPRLVELAAQAVANGLPDAAGAKIFSGTLTVARSLGSTGQRQQVGGMHLRLVDGRWLVGFTTVVPASEIQTDPGALQEVQPRELLATATALAHHPLLREMQQKRMDRLLAAVLPEDRERLRSSLAVAPLLELPWLRRDDATLTVHLIRLGVACAGDVAVLDGLLRQWDHNLLGGQSGPTPLRATIDVDPTELRQAPDITGIPVPTPEAALRGALFRAFYQRALCGGDPQDPMAESLKRGHAQMNPHEPGEPERSPSSAAEARVASEAAVAFAQTLLPEATPEVLAELALVLGRARLPLTAPPATPLAERLAVWDGDLAEEAAGRWTGTRPSQRALSRYVIIPSNGSTTLVAGEQDLDALFALLDDPRPCRWLDFGRVRTLGDNAWRAITGIVGCDPRSFIGRNPRAPWSAAERTATMSALRAWWAEHRHRPLEHAIESSIPRLAPRQLLGVLEQRPVGRRGGLLTVIAKLWTAGSPATIDERAVAGVLELSNGHAALADAVASWPVAGDLAPFLTAFHLTRGDRGPLAAQLDALFATPNEDVRNRYRLLPLLRFSPTPADLGRLVALMRGPLDAPGTAHLIEQVLFGLSSAGPGSELLQEWTRRQSAGDLEMADRRNEVLLLALLTVLLADERPASEQMVKDLMPRLGLRAAPDKPFAADVRVADVAAPQFHSHAYTVGKIFGYQGIKEIEAIVVDLSRPIAERDQKIAELRSVIGPPLEDALHESGLPDLVSTKGDGSEF